MEISLNADPLLRFCFVCLFLCLFGLTCTVVFQMMRCIRFAVWLKMHWWLLTALCQPKIVIIGWTKEGFEMLGTQPVERHIDCVIPWTRLAETCDHMRTNVVSCLIGKQCLHNCMRCHSFFLMWHHFKPEQTVLAPSFRDWRTNLDHSRSQVALCGLLFLWLESTSRPVAVVSTVCLGKQVQICGHWCNGREPQSCVVESQWGCGSTQNLCG